MKSKKVKRDNRRKMSWSAKFVIGLLAAALSLALIVAYDHYHLLFSPTIGNSERLLEKGRAREAKAMLDKLPDPRHGGDTQSAKPGDVRALVLRGKVLFAVVMEEMRGERWGSYGVNPDNWIAHPLADEAEQCFIDAKELAPDDPEIRMLLGNLYREQGRFADAESIFRSVLDIDGGHAGAFLALGLLYMEGGRIDAAQRALYYAWELAPEEPRIAKNIGYFYRFYKDVPESSAVWFARYLSANPRQDPDIGNVRAELRTLIERYPEFEERLESVNARNDARLRKFAPREPILPR